MAAFGVEPAELIRLSEFADQTFESPRASEGLTVKVIYQGGPAGLGFRPRVTTAVARSRTDIWSETPILRCRLKQTVPSRIFSSGVQRETWYLYPLSLSTLVVWCPVSALPLIEAALLFTGNPINVDVQVVPFCFARITASSVPSAYE
jgi:hypothetical protein